MLSAVLQHVCLVRYEKISRGQMSKKVRTCRCLVALGIQSNVAKHTAREKEITQCDTRAQRRNEFIFRCARELNKVPRLILVQKKKYISHLYPAKVFQLSALRSEKTEYGKNEDRTAQAPWKLSV